MNNSAKPKVLVILGPTATGKSDLAVAIAKETNGEIVSADSRQIYRGLDIGSGKITTEEMQSITHHMLDIADPRDRFSVEEYREKTNSILKEIISRGKLPIIVGGSGFYINAVVDNISFPEVPNNEELRKEMSKLSNPELMSWLMKLDTRRSTEVDPQNRRRIMRALEIAEALGHVPEIRSTGSDYDFIMIGLSLPAAELRSNIKTRLENRIRGSIENPDTNMIREGQSLYKNGLSFERMEKLGLEYKYLSYFLQNKITSEEFSRKLETEIWRYSKRQMTWFKRDKRIIWIEKPYLENWRKIWQDLN